ncbi:unnamed protein product, partial [Gulo gulo]
ARELTAITICATHSRPQVWETLANPDPSLWYSADPTRLNGLHTTSRQNKFPLVSRAPLISNTQLAYLQEMGKGT